MAVISQTVERLQAALAASKSSTEQLAQQLAAVKEKEEISHSRELKHVAEVAKQQARARVLDAAVDLSKARVEVLIAETRQLRDELVDLRSANGLLVEEKASIDRICQLEREQAAVARGEIMALEKRVATQVRSRLAIAWLGCKPTLPNLQDERLTNLERVKSQQQTHLAQANQRIVEPKKQADELEEARRRIEQLVSASSIIEDRLNASETKRAEALTETEAYRERFASLEKDLGRMKEAVRAELEETAGKLTSLAEAKAEVERETRRLKQRIAELEQTTPMYSTPAPTTGDRHSPFLHAPHPRHAHARQESSSSADSEGTIHEGVSHMALSPTPSLGGKSLAVDDSGWWSSS